MKLTWTVEYLNESGEYDYLEVEFEGFPTWQNDSFDYAGTHCTGGVGGTHQLASYTSMDDSADATWDKTKHTIAENEIIENWYKVNYEELHEQFCEKLEEK